MQAGEEDNFVRRGGGCLDASNMCYRQVAFLASIKTAVRRTLDALGGRVITEVQSAVPKPGIAGSDGDTLRHGGQLPRLSRDPLSPAESRSSGVSDPKQTTAQRSVLVSTDSSFR